MITQEIAQYLSQSGIGTLGEDIYLGESPEDSQDNIVWIIPTVSPKPRIDATVYDQFIDVWVRDVSWSTGHARAQEIVDNLHQKEHWETDSYYIYFSRLNGTIQDLDRDVNRRKLYLMNFGVLHTPKNGV